VRVSAADIPGSSRQQLRNPQHTVGYGIGIAAGFVRQLLKMSSIQYRNSLAIRNGPGGS
jgi:hypothetical protein